MQNHLMRFEPLGNPSVLLHGIQDDATSGELMMRRFYHADVENGQMRREMQMGLSMLTFEACRRFLEATDGGRYMRRAMLSAIAMLKDMEDEQLADEEKPLLGLFQWASREALRDILPQIEAWTSNLMIPPPLR